MKEMGFNMVRKHIKIEVGSTRNSRFSSQRLGGQMVLLGR